MNQRDVFGEAVWLGAENAQENSSGIWILRGRFSVGKIRSAVLRVIGLGFFHCFINGKPVSDDLFLPLNTEYEPRPNFPSGEILSGHRIYVPEYDVSSLLREGENVIAIHFGAGWYTCAQECKFGDAKAIWRISGEDENGSFDAVSSTNDRISQSFVNGFSFAGRLKAEVQDYTFQSSEALDDGFDDRNWKFAVPAKPLDTNYAFCDCPADRVCETLNAVFVGERNNLRVYDCGTNTSGYPVLRLSARAGERVKVRFSEELNADGSLHEKFVFGQSVDFISDGNERIVRPLFIWFGFRYFEIEGACDPLCVEVVHIAIPVTASFKSDNELLNWIHDTYLNTQLTNMHTGIPSDCPQIERRGYTGDGQLTCHAAMNMLGAESFYRKWMQDIADSQDSLSGHVQYTAPYTHSGGGPGGWGCAIVEVPYQFYRHYGDAAVLEKYYPSMLRYFDYLEAHSCDKLVVSDKEGEWCLGDWCTPISVILPAPFVNNYFYIKSLDRCIEIARIIGRSEDIPEFDRRIAERKAALNAAYFNRWDGNYLGNQQGANAFALDIGLGDERTYPNLVGYYQKLRRFDTGIFGTDIVTRLLFERGDGQLASELLLSTARTSFDGMRRSGATTLWEYWPNSLVDRSHNHPMFGAVTAYLYDYLLGIRAQEGSAGYRQLMIAPVLIEGVNRLSGSRTLPGGKVAVSYSKTENGISFEVEIPDRLPAVFTCLGKTRTLAPGRNYFTVQ